MSKCKDKRGKKLFIVIPLVILTILVTFLLLYTPSIKLLGKKNIEISYNSRYVEMGYYAKMFGLDRTRAVKVSNNINYSKVGTYEITYSVKNLLGCFSKEEIRTITIVDKIKPVIELQGGDISLAINEPYKELGYTAFDELDGNLTENVIVEDKVDNQKAGDYEVIYRVKDSSENEASLSRHVNVYERNAYSVPILTYHHFLTIDEKNEYAKDDKYTMPIVQFEEQLKYLKENGYNTIDLEDFYLWYIGKKTLTDKDIVIVIDDGNVSAYFYAIPLLEKYGFKATIFVITGRISENEISWDPSKLQFFNSKMIEDIRNNHKNIRLASHTHYLHAQIEGSCAVAKKTEDEIYEDVVLSKDAINSEYLAYPFGCHTNAAFSALRRAGYKMAFEFGDDRRATKKDQIYSIKRINVNAYTTMEKFIKWLEV